MKKTLLSLMLASTFLVVGCSVDKDFSFSIEKEFSATNYQSATYTTYATVDAKQSSSDFDKYRSDLQSLNIESASYTVTYFQGPATQQIVAATLTVSDFTGGNPHTIATISNVNLLASAAKNHDLPLDAAGKQFFKEQLMGSSSSARLTFSATTNETPITFTVKFRFQIKATYSKELL